MARRDDIPSHPRGPYTFAETRVPEHKTAEGIAASQAFAEAKAKLAQVTAEAYADGIVTESEARAIAAAQAEANAAEVRAKAYSDGIVTDAEARAIAHADAEAYARKVEAEAYADGIVTASEQRSIDHANAVAEAKKIEAQAYADGIVTDAEAAAIAESNAYADLKKIEAEAYADGIVTEEEARAIADAQAKYEAAKSYADQQDEYYNTLPVVDSRLSENVALLNRGLPFTVKQLFNGGLETAGDIRLTGAGKTIYGVTTDPSKPGSVATWEYVRDAAAAKTTYSDLWDNMVVKGLMVTQPDSLTVQVADGWAYVGGRRSYIPAKSLGFQNWIDDGTYVIYLSEPYAPEGSDILQADVLTLHVIDNNWSNVIDEQRVIALVTYSTATNALSGLKWGADLNNQTLQGTKLYSPYLAKLYADVNGLYDGREVVFAADERNFSPLLAGVDLGGGFGNEWQNVRAAHGLFSGSLKVGGVSVALTNHGHFSAMNNPHGVTPGQIGALAGTGWSDWNAVTAGKVTPVWSATGGPEGTKVYGGLTVPVHDASSYALQIAGRDGAYYLRSMTNYVWNGWERVYTTGHKPTAEAIGAQPASSWLNKITAPPVHGSVGITGSKNLYAGIDFLDANVRLMIRLSDGLSGVYDGAASTWKWYFDGSGVLASGQVPWARLLDIPSNVRNALPTTGGTLSGNLNLSTALYYYSGADWGRIDLRTDAKLHKYSNIAGVNARWYERWYDGAVYHDVWASAAGFNLGSDLTVNTPGGATIMRGGTTDFLRIAGGSSPTSGGRILLGAEGYTDGSTVRLYNDSTLRMELTKDGVTRLFNPGGRMELWGNGVGYQNVSYIGFFDSNGTRQGYVGDTSSNNSAVALVAETGVLRLIGANSGGQVDIGDDPSWPLKIQNSYGYIHFGPANASYAHIYTDRPGFYFNQKLAVAGDLDLQGSQYLRRLGTAHIRLLASSTYFYQQVQLGAGAVNNYGHTMAAVIVSTGAPTGSAAHGTLWVQV